MVVYISMTVLTLIFGYFFTHNKKPTESNKSLNLEIWTVLIVWVLVYSLRYMTGTDFGGYLRSFNLASRTDYSSYMTNTRDFAFYSLTYFLSKLFNGNFIAYEMVLAILSYLPILIVCREESEDYTFSALLFIFIMNFYNPFNGVRQGIAVSLLFYAHYMLFKRKKYIKYIIMVIIAFGFHSTVLFVVPLFLLSSLKVNNKFLWIVIGGITASFFALNSLWGNIIKLFEATGQEKLANDYASITLEGSSFTRFLVSVLPVVVGLVFYKKLKETRDDIDSDIILSLFAAIFMLFSMKTWIFARISYYFSSAPIILISKIPHMFNKEKNKYAIAILIVVLYFAYMVALLLHGEGNYLPYTFIPDMETVRNFR